MNSLHPLHAEAESSKPRVAIPTTLETSQDGEWVLAKLDGHWEEIRIQNYPRLFEVPGLYEHVVYDALECRSPQVIASLLEERLREANQSMDRLRVLDLGAGNGCVAEEFRRHGTRRFIGVDICDEAAEAADRDRPELYDQYLVDDMTRPKPATADALRRAELNCLCCVAALGFDDIPADAFAKSLEFVLPGGWVAFTIKSDFVEKRDVSGFRRLIDRLVETKAVEVEERVPYTHRLSTDGRALEYIAYVARRASPPLPSSS